MRSTSDRHALPRTHVRSHRDRREAVPRRGRNRARGRAARGGCRRVDHPRAGAARRRRQRGGGRYAPGAQRGRRGRGDRARSWREGDRVQVPTQGSSPGQEGPSPGPDPPPDCRHPVQRTERRRRHHEGAVEGRRSQAPRGGGRAPGRRGRGPGRQAEPWHRGRRHVLRGRDQAPEAEPDQAGGRGGGDARRGARLRGCGGGGSGGDIRACRQAGSDGPAALANQGRRRSVGRCRCRSRGRGPRRNRSAADDTPKAAPKRSRTKKDE